VTERRRDRERIRSWDVTATGRPTQIARRTSWSGDRTGRGGAHHGDPRPRGSRLRGDRQPAAVAPAAPARRAAGRRARGRRRSAHPRFLGRTLTLPWCWRRAGRHRRRSSTSTARRACWSAATTRRAAATRRAPTGSRSSGSSANLRCSPAAGAGRRADRHDHDDAARPAGRDRPPLRAGAGGATLAVTLQSFSYKKGAPLGADMVMDVRFLRNPHWDRTAAAARRRDPVVAFDVARRTRAGALHGGWRT
jgi:hypothetical protein